eukprot:Em0024g392a
MCLGGLLAGMGEQYTEKLHPRCANGSFHWHTKPFTAAIWKASGDVGYQGYLLGKNVGVATPCNNSRIRMASHPQPERCGNGHEAKLIDIFNRLYQRAHVSKDSMEQLKCQHYNRLDRALAHVGYLIVAPKSSTHIIDFMFTTVHDARGDQCDKCGNLINAIELKSPRCKICSNQPKVESSNHLFLDFAMVSPSRRVVWELAEVTSSPAAVLISGSVVLEVIIRGGVVFQCHPDHQFLDQGWSEATIYLSITACYTKEWEKWWKNPEHVQLYQFMAKDNVPFHTVVFSSSLPGVEDNHTLLHMSSTEQLPGSGSSHYPCKTTHEADITRELQGYVACLEKHTCRYQFMAKDNVPFHTVVFPSSLLGAGDNHTFLNHMSSRLGSSLEGCWCPKDAEICTCTTRNALALEHIMISSDQQRLICKAGQEARFDKGV